MKRTTILILVLLLVPARACRVAAEEHGVLPTDDKDYSFTANVKSPEQFPEWKKHVLYFYHRTLRIRPDYRGLPPDVRYEGNERISDRLVRHKISYATTDGLRIPAYLFIPETPGKVPVVIVYHGHGDGKINTVAGGEGTNENALARYIAEKLGYVVLAPDARSFGEFEIGGKNRHYDYFLSLIFKKQLYMAKLMEDGYQDLAVIKTIENADREKIGVAGISMGSWRTLNFAAMHDEVGAAVVSGLYIPWKWLFSEAHCRCQHIPKLAEHMGMEDLAALVFPRRLMIQWGLDDKYHEQDAEALIDRTESIADFLGFEESFSVDRHEGMGHQFSNPGIATFFHDALGDGAWPFEN